MHIVKICVSTCISLCMYVREGGLYHLAGRPGRKIPHHFVHLFKLLGHGLNLSMQFLVLSILVIEHSLVLVLLLLRMDAGVLPVDRRAGESTFSWAAKYIHTKAECFSVSSQQDAEDDKISLLIHQNYWTDSDISCFLNKAASGLQFPQSSCYLKMLTNLYVTFICGFSQR